MRPILFFFICIHFFSCANREQKIETKLSDIDFSFLSDTSKLILPKEDINTQNKCLGILSINSEGEYFAQRTLPYHQRIKDYVEVSLKLYELDHFPFEQINYQQKKDLDQSIKYIELKSYNPSLLLTIKNELKDTIGINQHDNSLFLIQEAKDKNGIWKEIEVIDRNKCGNSFWTSALPPHQLMLVQIPKYTGDFQTFVRVKLKTDRQLFYSDSILGKVNSHQFQKKGNLFI